MNLKVAHLLSVQFGIFIGIVSCLVFYRFESARPRHAAEVRKTATERAPILEPRSEPEDQATDMMDDDAAPEQADRINDQPIPAMPNEYSPEAVEKSRAILTRLYYEQIAPRRNASSVPANSSIAAVAPAYTEVAEEPMAVQYDDPAPQTVAYQQPPQVIVYSQPAQFIAFSQPRRFVNRCRSAPHPGVLASNSPRRRDSGGTQSNGLPGFQKPASPSAPRPPRSLGLGRHGNTGAQTCPSPQGFTSRGKR